MRFSLVSQLPTSTHDIWVLRTHNCTLVAHLTEKKKREKLWSQRS